MKNSMVRWMMAAAALTVAASGAMAQSYKATIPMAFHAGLSDLQPGSYEIRVLNGNAPLISVLNVATHKGVLVIPHGRTAPPQSWVRSGAARLEFECDARTCSLTRMWDGSSYATVTFPAHKRPAVEASNQASPTVIAMTRIQ